MLSRREVKRYACSEIKNGWNFTDLSWENRSAPVHRNPKRSQDRLAEGNFIKLFTGIFGRRGCSKESAGTCQNRKIVGAAIIRQTERFGEK
jgi:hypothetical protein